MPDLALGTAQFGLNYGITNVGGQVTTADATLLLNHAEDVGVTFIDTAQAYGNAEFVLCDALPANHSFRIISKLPPNPFTTLRFGSRPVGSSRLKPQLRECMSGNLTHCFCNRQ